jgi:hypothetical protein
VKSDNTSSKSFSNNLAPSKDSGTCRKELIEKERKMHNLKIECEEERVSNTSIDGLFVKFYNTRK